LPFTFFLYNSPKNKWVNIFLKKKQVRSFFTASHRAAPLLLLNRHGKQADIADYQESNLETKTKTEWFAGIGDALDPLANWRCR
jgi:hypothetical protein